MVPRSIVGAIAVRFRAFQLAAHVRSSRITFFGMTQFARRRWAWRSLRPARCGASHLRPAGTSTGRRHRVASRRAPFRTVHVRTSCPIAASSLFALFSSELQRRCSLTLRRQGSLQIGMIEARRVHAVTRRRFELIQPPARRHHTAARGNAPAARATARDRSARCIRRLRRARAERRNQSPRLRASVAAAQRRRERRFRPTTEPISAPPAARTDDLGINAGVIPASIGPARGALPSQQLSASRAPRPLHVSLDTRKYRPRHCATRRRERQRRDRELCAASCRDVARGSIPQSQPLLRPALP